MTGEPRHHFALIPTLFAFGALLFLYIPLVVVVLFSFQSSGSLTLPFDGPSLHWYREVFSDGQVRQAAQLSVAIAAITAVVTLVIGTMAAYGLSHVSSRWRGPLTFVLIVPIAVPGLFLGLALLAWFQFIHINLSSLTIVIAHCVYAFPYFIILARVAFDRMDPAYEEVASDLGATPIASFRRVVLPQIWPILVGAAALTFMLSFDEFVATFLVAGSSQTLPIYIFSELRRTITPTINVISTLLLGLTLLLWTGAFVAVFITSRRHGTELVSQ